jgi:hypothetical protein
MKKNVIFVAVLMTALVGCSSDDEVLENASKSVTISAGIGADTRTTFTEDNSGTAAKFVVNWESTDVLTAYASATNLGTFNTPTVAADAHNATFSGSFATTPADQADVYAYINRSKVTIDASTVSTDLSSQDGTKDDATLHDIMYAAGKYDASTSNVALDFGHKMSFLKLVLTFPDTETGTAITNLTLSGDGLYRGVTFTLSTGVLASYQEGSIVIPSATIDTQHKATVYVCVYPGALSNVTAYATVGSNAYTFSIQGSTAKTLASQKLYTVSRTYASVANLTETATAFAGGDGKTVATPYLISNLAQLKYLASVINAKNGTYTGSKFYRLTNDIYLGDGSVEWSPIGASNTLGTAPFSPTFDGDGHTITGKIKMTAQAVKSGATNAYGLFGVVNGTVMNLVNKASVEINNNSLSPIYAGAIVGRVEGSGKIINCSNSGDVSGIAECMGGITGSCYASGTNICTIEACSNFGNVTDTKSGSYVGGIIGEGNSRGGTVAIRGCRNSGLNLSATSGSIGGILGRCNLTQTGQVCSVSACWSSATSIIGGSNKALIVGYAAFDATFTSCYAKSITGIAKLIVSASNHTGATTNCDTFNTLLPSSESISNMNTTWASSDYKFDSQGTVVKQ